MVLKKHGNRILLFLCTLFFLILTSFNIQLFAANNESLFAIDDLQTEWESTGTITSVDNGYISTGSAIETLSIQGNIVTYQETTYWEPDYAGGIYEIETYVYKVTLGDTIISTDGEIVKRIKMETIDYYWQPFNWQEINDNASEYRGGCGFIPAPGEIIHEGDCSDIPHEYREIGIISYGLFQIDNNILYINGLSIFPDNDHYPDALNKGSWGTDKWSLVEETLFTYYRDNDDDGYGDPNSPFEATSQPSGYVTDNNDCNDDDSSIHPGASEIRGDGIDQDCNGSDLPQVYRLTQTQVSQLYISIFGRASEGSGNTYWQTTQEDMVVAADTMLATGSAKDYFGATLDDDQAFIEFIYENTLGKTYAEDPDGVDYWVGELASGKSKGQVTSTLINAVMDPKYAGMSSQNRFINKVTVCNYTADTIDTCPNVNDLSAFVGAISGVTDNSATVTTAKGVVDTF
ncbi:MAG: DUF4214 domain-containing protein [Desulfobacteraceae bacterium]|nr:DUF4214 domain-containing protein [Desulfobacteraceae bacterium]